MEIVRTTNNLENIFIKEYWPIVSEHEIIHDENHFTRRVNRNAKAIVFYCGILGFLAELVLYAIAPEMHVISLNIVVASIIVSGSVVLVNGEIGSHKEDSARQNIIFKLGEKGRIELAAKMKRYGDSRVVGDLVNEFKCHGEHLKNNLTKHAVNLLSDELDRQKKAIDYLFGWGIFSLSDELRDVTEFRKKVAQWKVDDAREVELELKLSKLSQKWGALAINDTNPRD